MIDLNSLLERIKENKNKKFDFENDSLVSYTQYSAWDTCAHRWWLQWIEKNKQPPSIHMTFGTAIHESIQQYLEYFYKDVQLSRDFPITEFFQDKMVELYEKDSEKHGEHYSNKEEFVEFINDGIDILNFFVANSLDYFNHQYMLLGVEVPLIQPIIDEHNHVKIYSKLDLVWYNLVNHTILIDDIKTSTYGWYPYAMKDFNKISQLISYKKYFSKQYDIPISKVDVRFFIVKRKLNEKAKNPLYAKNRIQIFKPKIQKKDITLFENKLGNFVEEGFINRPEIPEKNPSDKNCKYCPFLNNICDGKK